MIVSLSHPTITVNSEGGAIPCPGTRPDSLRGGVSQERAALTIATMPAFIASGRSGHASTTAAKPGSATRQCGGAFWVAVGGRIEAESVVS